jgi:uncharacterized repeat protein (TIGR02543 family)
MRGGFNNRDISYELNGGGGSAPTAITVVEGTTITLASSPTRVGYQFAGWQVGANRYSPNSSYLVTTSVVFTASWTPKAVAFSYVLNGGGGGNAAAGSVNSDASFTFASAPTRTGYNFTGWKINDAGTVYSAGTSITMPASDSPIVIYAQWTAKDVFGYYDLGGGSY